MKYHRRDKRCQRRGQSWQPPAGSENLPSRNISQPDQYRSKQNRQPPAQMPPQNFAVIGPKLNRGMNQRIRVGEIIGQMAARAIEQPQPGRWLNPGRGPGNNKVVQRRRVGFVTGFSPLGERYRQAAVLGDETGVQKMGVLIVAHGQRGDEAVRRGGQQIDQQDGRQPPVSRQK